MTSTREVPPFKMLHRMVLTGKISQSTLKRDGSSWRASRAWWRWMKQEEQRGHTQKEHPTVKRQQGQGRMHGRHRQLRCPTAQTMLRLKHTRSKWARLPWQLFAWWCVKRLLSSKRPSRTKFTTASRISRRSWSRRKKHAWNSKSASPNWRKERAHKDRTLPWRMRSSWRRTRLWLVISRNWMVKKPKDLSMRS